MTANEIKQLKLTIPWTIYCFYYHNTNLLLAEPSPVSFEVPALSVVECVCVCDVDDSGAGGGGGGGVAVAAAAAAGGSANEVGTSELEADDVVGA